MNIGDLPAQLFSPFKFALILLGVLIGFDKIAIGTQQGDDLSIGCLLVVVFFGVVLEIAHNDYLRIILNGRAESRFLWMQKR